MRRRYFTIGLGVSAAIQPLLPWQAHAQQSTKVPRLCFLTFDPGTLRTRSPRFDAFFQGLEHLGYVDGRTIEIRYLSADNNGDRFPALIEECLSLKPGRDRGNDNTSGSSVEEGDEHGTDRHGRAWRPSRDRDCR